MVLIFEIRLLYVAIFLFVKKKNFFFAPPVNTKVSFLFVNESLPIRIMYDAIEVIVLISGIRFINQLVFIIQFS